MNPCTDILLVEDDPGDIHLAMSVFRALHLADRCIVVNDGEQALEYLQVRGNFAQRPPGLPRLILLDLKMPRMNGFEFLEAVKSDEKYRPIPVVALTSSREQCDVERAYDLRVNAYVVKSIDFADYRSTLNALARYWEDVNEPTRGFVECGSVSRTHSRASGIDPVFWGLAPC